MIRMDDQKLQDWLAKELRIDRVPRPVWEALDEERLIEYAQAVGVEDAGDDLLSAAKRYLKCFRGGGSDREPNYRIEDGGVEQEKFGEELGEYEKERAAAFSEYHAKLAADTLSVRSFREYNLGGQDEVLTIEQAERLMSSDGALAILNSIDRVSRHLAKEHPWTEEQAAWFVLTGETPSIAPATGRINRVWKKVHTHGTITLMVEPWLSPETVRDAYLRLQKKALNRNNRRIGARNLALFRFVVGEVESIHALGLRQQKARAKWVKRRSGTATELAGSSWRELKKQWNAWYPEGHPWHYKEVQNFARDFRATERKIANPI